MMDSAILSLVAGRNTHDGIAKRLGIPAATVERAAAFLDMPAVSPVEPFSRAWSTSRRITIDEIKRAVCGEFQLSRAQMVGPCRARALAHPRQVAMFLARELSGQSFPRIGAAFGGRDHTTVIYACRAVRYRMLFDAGLSRRVVALARALDNGENLPQWRRFGSALRAVQAIAEALR